MLNAYERRLMLGYLSNVASRFNHRSPQAEALDLCLTAHDDLLGLSQPNQRATRAKRRKPSGGNPSVKKWQAVRQALSDALVPVRRRDPIAPPGAFDSWPPRSD